MNYIFGYNWSNHSFKALQATLKCDFIYNFCAFFHFYKTFFTQHLYSIYILMFDIIVNN